MAPPFAAQSGFRCFSRRQPARRRRSSAKRLRQERPAYATSSSTQRPLRVARAQELMSALAFGFSLDPLIGVVLPGTSAASRGVTVSSWYG